MAALKLSIEGGQQLGLFENPDQQNLQDPDPLYNDRPATLQPTLDLEPELTDEATVTTVQRKLRDLGWYEVGDCDGKIGERTRGGIKLAQEANGLTPDGRITKTFLDAMATFPPRSVAVTRANATAAELAPKVEGIAVTRKAKFKSAVEAWFYGALAAISAAWAAFKEHVGGTARDLITWVSDMPGYAWFLIIFGFAIAGYAWSKRGEEIQTEDYNKGKRL